MDVSIRASLQHRQSVDHQGAVMNHDVGWKMRSDVLLRTAEDQFLAPLRNHGWTVAVERVERAGEYAVISAERNGVHRKAALLYTSATDAQVYKRLETEVDYTYFHGAPYMVEEFAKGTSRPVYSSSDFHVHLAEWNKESVPGKLMPATISFGASDHTPDLRPRIRRLLSETPIDAIWARLSALRSSTIARKAVAWRAAVNQCPLAVNTTESKGDGVAYAIRSATEYFTLKNTSNLSQRVLSLYYGSLSFAFAEMLAHPTGPSQLSSIEDMTKQGHGLWTFDGVDDGFGGVVVGPIPTGFFPAWMKSVGAPQICTMDKKPRRVEDLGKAPDGSWATLEQLFARIPEVGYLFEDVFTGPPAWITPAADPDSMMSMGLFRSTQKAASTYIQLFDDSGRMTPEDIARFPGPIREITLMTSDIQGRSFRAAVDHPGADRFWDVLKVHTSPFERAALIKPLFGGVDEYRAICVIVLYTLSILVRYRPSLWRRIEEGDLDHLRALIEAFLAVSERVLPEHFLASVTGELTVVAQPGSFFS